MNNYLQCTKKKLLSKYLLKNILWMIFVSAILIGNFSASAEFTSSSDQNVGGEKNIEKLPYCGNEAIRDLSRRLVYVSTLDGTISALDITNNGKLKWKIPTNPGTMLSSSIHQLELTNNGRWVRMIPSLNGALYKFDGETIEPIPITVDHLLSSSFKFSDDLVISGGKETRTYGISSRTGKVLYECSMHNCKNATEIDEDDVEMHGPPRASTIEEDLEHDPLIDDVVIVRRQTQTVRALEPRTGGERWNFSVSNHELELLKPRECHQRDHTEQDKMLWDLELKVIVPEGIICAVSKEAPNVILWQYKFSHPIVSAWRSAKDDSVENLDLFSYSHWPWSIDEKPNNFGELAPSVYVGMFNKQLYIQESDKLKKIILATAQGQLLEGMEYLKIPWRPYPATSSALSLIKEDAVVNDQDKSVTAISVLYESDYVDGHGFFLFSPGDLNLTQNGLCNKKNSTDNSEEIDDNGFPFNGEDTPAKIIIVSLWFWWKEIMVISLTTALILNVVLSRRMSNSREVVIVERHVEIQVPMAMPDKPHDEIIIRRSVSESSENFVSRFQTDFEMVQCLGKGGFGVVFESQNKLDDCKYAIKRIVLPNRIESRERVMREVKTLANCEHQNIVRYFQAWVETPPPDWQEKEDRIWMDREALSHSIDIESPTEPTSPPLSKVFSEAINRRDKGLDSWISNLNTNECINFDDDNRKTKFGNNNIDDDDDDSFIQFKDETENSLSDAVFRKDSNELYPHSTTTESSNNNVTTSDDDDEDENDGDVTADNNVADKDDDDDDSFQIEFKEPSVDNNANPVTLTNGNSFSIVFQKTTPNGSSSNITTHSTTPNRSFSIDNNSNPFQFRRHPNGIKQRTFSENLDFNNSIYKKTGCSFFAAGGGGLTIGNDSNSSSVHQRNITNSSNQNGKMMVPFKKTHRRPMSLDLSIRRSVDLFQNHCRMYLYIQMQLCKKQSLKDWLRLNNLECRQDNILPIFRQIVDGVEYCHMKGLIHRDLKPSNIFFSLDDQIKIGDFGLVTDMSDIPNTPCGDISGLPCAKHTEQVGTHLYMSPEQLQGRQYNYKVDIYSLGLIFFELLVVFGTEMERIETLKALRNSIFPKGFSSAFSDEYELLKIMLSQLPKERPTTIGVRARPPLNCPATNPEWHFELPPRRRDSHISGGINSSSSSITEFLKSKNL